MTNRPHLEYGPRIIELLANAPVNELGPGRANSVQREALSTVTAEKLAAPYAIADHEMVQACLSGLWLRHNFLSESHEISQEIPSSTGSYWHAIMHRREPDFSNSKYWWRRVGTHPVFHELHPAARELAQAAKIKEAAFLISQSSWDPNRFVDLCQAALDGNVPLQELCIAVQLREWELLFEYSFQQAVSAA